ncbi:MAG: hypothetical protein ABIN94_11000 [Ferruginibacter sp.]
MISRIFVVALIFPQTSARALPGIKLTTATIPVTLPVESLEIYETSSAVHSEKNNESSPIKIIA